MGQDKLASAESNELLQITVGDGSTDYLVYIAGVLHVDVPIIAELRANDSGDPPNTWHIVGGSAKHFLFRTDNTYGDLGTASFYYLVDTMTTLNTLFVVLWLDRPDSLERLVYQNWFYIDLIVVPIQKQEEGWNELS